MLPKTQFLRRDQMKLFGLLAVGIGITVAALACAFMFAEPLHEPLTPYINPFGDTCVITVTHPDLVVRLISVENAGENCDRCRYTFGVINKTAAIGTKARDVTVYTAYERGPVGPNGEPIPLRRLDGSVDARIQPIPYDVVRDEVQFVIEGPCPECLYDDERCVTFFVQYFDCSGINRYEFEFNLKAQRITINGPTTLRTTGGCD